MRPSASHDGSVPLTDHDGLAVAAPIGDPERLQERDRLVRGFQVLGELVEGARGEEGMRQHYLALMHLCAQSIAALNDGAGIERGIPAI